jgi:hypothetical protein
VWFVKQGVKKKDKQTKVIKPKRRRLSDTISETGAGAETRLDAVGGIEAEAKATLCHKSGIMRSTEAVAEAKAKGSGAKRAKVHELAI